MTLPFNREYLSGVLSNLIDFGLEHEVESEIYSLWMS